MVDKVLLLIINYGCIDIIDGCVFKYIFLLLFNFYSEILGIVNYIVSKEGGSDKFKGKKIVVLYYGLFYGKEIILIYKLLLEKYGFLLQQIEVLYFGNDQQV